MAHKPYAQVSKCNKPSLPRNIVPTLATLAVLSCSFLQFAAVFFALTPMPYADAQSQGDQGTVLVKYGDTTFEIATTFSNGKVVNATVIPEDSQLLLDLEPSQTEDGQLVVTLPRALIDSRSADLSADEQFTIVFSDSEAIYEETNSTDTARTLSIDIPVGTEYLTIIGTQVVPEFPMFVLLIAALALASIIGLNRLARRPGVRR